ncbi:hypothetical protein FHE72_04200 [Rossellomorea vietnamensis]|uniref:Uncharacterized protein n=1 Tax=Rossellomorea vietnamensis TaxID=218284 RepID=A0A6I6UED4_9BACI|nr:hypothetical protein [Rossellomorea vietnamensis]QHE60328.1 hypothetical protein FHE72_04200 [Rossellomorea vietnamensis]
MLTKPEFNQGKIIDGLKEHFHIAAKEVTFLPIGHDPKAAVYRVTGGVAKSFF